MKLNVIAAMLLVMNFVGLHASQPSSQLNIPHLTQIYATLESHYEKTNGNRTSFYAIAGLVSEYAEQTKKPEEQKCDGHVLSLMNAMSLTPSPVQRAKHLEHFSTKYAQCDQFVPGFLCNKND